MKAFVITGFVIIVLTVTLFVIKIPIAGSDTKKQASNNLFLLKKNDWLNENLKGHVSETHDISYAVSERFGRISKEFKLVEEYRLYDKGGYLISSKLKIENGSDDGAFGNGAYLYDTNKFLTVKEIYKANGILLSKELFKYGKDGNITEMNEFDGYNGEFIQRELYVYNDKGIRTETWFFDDTTKSLVKKEIYKFDDLGNKVEVTQLDQLNNLKKKTVFAYDTVGNIIESTTYNSSSIFDGHSIIKYVYDDKGNWKTKTVYDKNGKANFLTEREINYYNNVSIKSSLNKPAINNTVENSADIRKVSLSEIPTIMKFMGNFIDGIMWKDNNGVNYLIISEKKSGSYGSDNYIDTLFGCCFNGSDLMFRKLWEIREGANIVSETQYIKGSLKVIDIDNDGIYENSFLYQSMGDGASSIPIKLILHSNSKKYPIRGEYCPEIEVCGNYARYTIGSEFSNVPNSFRDYAIREWNTTSESLKK